MRTLFGEMADILGHDLRAVYSRSSSVGDLDTLPTAFSAECIMDMGWKDEDTSQNRPAIARVHFFCATLNRIRIRPVPAPSRRIN